MNRNDDLSIEAAWVASESAKKDPVWDQFLYEDGSPGKKAAWLVRAGYQQTSAKYRHVARLPPGKTAIEALKEADPDAYRKILEDLERMAASTYRRMYAERRGDSLTLHDREFKAFKAAGGIASW